MIDPLPPPLFLRGEGGRVLSALIHLDLRGFFARISMEVTNPEHDKHSPRESIKLGLEQYGPVGRTTINPKKGVFHKLAWGRVGRAEAQSCEGQGCSVGGVDWDSGETACEMARLPNVPLLSLVSLSPLGIAPFSCRGWVG